MLDFDEVELFHDAEHQRMKEEARAWPTIDVYDKNWVHVTRLAAEIAGDCEDICNDAGEANVPMYASNPVAEWLSEEVEEEEDVHLIIEQSRTRWAGKVRKTSEVMESDGLEYCRINAIHVFDQCKHVYCYPNPLFPIQIQAPKIFAWAGSAKTGILLLLFLNLMRQFAPVWRLPDNPFDPQSWRDSLDPSKWPMIIDPRGLGWYDTSEWTVFATRMGNFYDLVRPILDDSGLQLIGEQWMPGDPQPFPEWVILTQPILIWRIVDKSGVRGPTGTLIDGAIRYVARVADDLVSEVTEAVPWVDPPEYMVQGWFGTKPEAPAVVWYSAQRYAIEGGTGASGITGWERHRHAALAKAVVTGGKSPGWVNSSVKLIANAILGYIGAIFLNPGLALGVFDKYIEDVFLAWARIENRPRGQKMGKYANLEHFETADNGFGLSTLTAIRTGFFKTRAYTSFRVSVINGAPYFVGYHLANGDRVSAENGRSRKLYTDQIRALKLTWSREQDPNWAISIGVDDDEQMPTARLGRQLEHVRTIVQAVSVSS